MVFGCNHLVCSRCSEPVVNLSEGAMRHYECSCANLDVFDWRDVVDTRPQWADPPFPSGWACGGHPEPTPVEVIGAEPPTGGEWADFVVRTIGEASVTSGSAATVLERALRLLPEPDRGRLAKGVLAGLGHRGLPVRAACIDALRLVPEPGATEALQCARDRFRPDELAAPYPQRPGWSHDTLITYALRAQLSNEASNPRGLG